MEFRPEMHLEPDKYFIVSVDHEDYALLIAEKGYPPGRCFQCATPEEAIRGLAANARCGIPARLVATHAWVAAHGRPWLDRQDESAA